jgi:hypothetical protein
MHIKRMIQHIVDKGHHEDMVCLSELLTALIYDLKHEAYAEYKHIEYKLHTMAYGEHLTEDMAHEWVSRMKNKDGTHGEHWSKEQTDKFAETHNKCDWYAVMNMVYSDYYQPAFTTETYITLAKDWIEDSDVPEGKTLKYYLHVVCKEE